ncbi:MAG: dihydroorotate dehydrogenase [Candidatus Omnitrophica bacterium]|nr:dihydroorotate dehydrogenase [Candidatus Omnitrophota bacterium]
MTVNLAVSIGKLKLKNPVMVGSGTFGYAEEFGDFVDLKNLGAIVTKTITIKPRSGNPSPRTCETPAGMLNSIGLENPGIDKFISEKLTELLKIGPPIIVSISSIGDPKEFITLAARLDKIKAVAAIELNLSCPNIKEHSRLISQNPKFTHAVVKMTRKVTKKTLIAKLSPNVTDIVEIAKAAEDGGADAVSLINTLGGMSIDVKSRTPKIAMITGGLSGPAIRPVAVCMVWETYRKIKIPIIGMGGIMDTQNALEFFMAGATAVSIGTGNFINPGLTMEIIRGLESYLSKNKLSGINQLTGSVKT